jgi:hypothetical protein
MPHSRRSGALDERRRRSKAVADPGGCRESLRRADHGRSCGEDPRRPRCRSPCAPRRHRDDGPVEPSRSRRRRGSWPARSASGWSGTRWTRSARSAACPSRSPNRSVRQAVPRSDSVKPLTYPFGGDIQLGTVALTPVRLDAENVIRRAREHVQGEVLSRRRDIGPLGKGRALRHDHECGSHWGHATGFVT